MNRRINSGRIADPKTTIADRAGSRRPVKSAACSMRNAGVRGGIMERQHSGTCRPIDSGRVLQLAMRSVSSPSRHWAICSGVDRSRPKHRSGDAVRSRTVDSSPRSVGPLSRIRSIRPSRSARTCSARVGEMRFERLALGRPEAVLRARSSPGRLAAGTRSRPCRGRRSHVGDQGRPGQNERQGAGPEPVGQPSGGLGPESRRTAVPARLLARARSAD